MGWHSPYLFPTTPGRGCPGPQLRPLTVPGSGWYSVPLPRAPGRQGRMASEGGDTGDGVGRLYTGLLWAGSGRGATSDNGGEAERPRATAAHAGGPHRSRWPRTQRSFAPLVARRLGLLVLFPDPRRRRHLGRGAGAGAGSANLGGPLCV